MPGFQIAFVFVSGFSSGIHFSRPDDGTSLRGRVGEGESSQLSQQITIFPTQHPPERYLGAADESVRGLAGGGVERLLDELADAARVL